MVWTRLVAAEPVSPKARGTIRFSKDVDMAIATLLERRNGLESTRRCHPRRVRRVAREGDVAPGSKESGVCNWTGKVDHKMYLECSKHSEWVTARAAHAAKSVTHVAHAAHATHRQPETSKVSRAVGANVEHHLHHLELLSTLTSTVLALLGPLPTLELALESTLLALAFALLAFVLTNTSGLLQLQLPQLERARRLLRELLASEQNSRVLVRANSILNTSDDFVRLATTLVLRVRGRCASTLCWGRSRSAGRSRWDGLVGGRSGRRGRNHSRRTRVVALVVQKVSKVLVFVIDRSRLRIVLRRSTPNIRVLLDGVASVLNMQSYHVRLLACSNNHDAPFSHGLLLPAHRDPPRFRYGRRLPDR
jgi:hypothetical protein